MQEIIIKVDGLKREYRRVHTQLKRLDEQKFATDYPDYDDGLRKLTESFKIASKTLNDLRMQNKAHVKQREAAIANAQNEKEKRRCLNERSYFIDQTRWELHGDWDDISDLDALKTLISSFEARLEKFGTICSEVQVWLDQSPGSEDI